MAIVAIQLFIHKLVRIISESISCFYMINLRVSININIKEWYNLAYVCLKAIISWQNIRTTIIWFLHNMLYMPT
jgi:hypothetical protein